MRNSYGLCAEVYGAFCETRRMLPDRIIGAFHACGESWIRWMMAGGGLVKHRKVKGAVTVTGSAHKFEAWKHHINK